MLKKFRVEELGRNFYWDHVDFQHGAERRRLRVWSYSLSGRGFYHYGSPTEKEFYDKYEKLPVCENTPTN
ncbi:MAG: hypothetical protein ACOX3T_00925 [Bdellovibrionota bacterium]